MADLIDHDNVYLTILDYPNREDADKLLIDGIITAASIAIERRCNRVFAVANLTEVRSGDGSDTILANRVPINSITSIVFKSSTDVTNDGANFLFDPESGEIRWKQYNLTDPWDYQGYFPKGFRNIELNYNGGFTVIPETIQQVCAQVVIQLFNREDADFQLVQDKIGSKYIKFDQERILFTHNAVLSLYRHRNVITDAY